VRDEEERKREHLSVKSIQISFQVLDGMVVQRKKRQKERGREGESCKPCGSSQAVPPAPCALPEHTTTPLVSTLVCRMQHQLTISLPFKHNTTSSIAVCFLKASFLWFLCDYYNYYYCFYYHYHCCCC
jgi:hypothetical protein